MPFGEEIFSVGGRTAGLGYNSDAVRKKFTGYERDSESGLDCAQARYFNSGYGRFSSPDPFTNDTHVSDPQSWDLYTYVKNNPLNVVDPLGKKGEISWRTDKKGVIHVKLKASFAIYGAKGQNVSKQDLKTYRDALANGINSRLTKTFSNIAGKTFDVKTDIKVKIKDDEASAIRSGSDNIVEIGYGQLDNHGGDASGVAFNVQGESFDRVAISVEPNPANFQGLGDPVTMAGEIAAHEFGAHLLSGGHSDNPDSLFFGNILGNGSSQFSPSDFTRLFTGNDDSFPSPPPFPGSKPFAGPYDNIGPSGKSERRANSRNNSSPSAVYTWITGVKQ
jgi:RHS repeat-associated protein